VTTLNLRQSDDYGKWFDGYQKHLWSDRDNPQFAYVPENVGLGSLIGYTSSGADRFLIVSSAAPQTFSDRVTITGYGLDGKVAPLAFSNRFADARNPLSDVPGEAGLGVFDDGGRWAGQIDYYEDHPIHGSGSEELVIDFGGTVTDLSLTASMVGSREEGLYNEAGKWTAYGADGRVIGSGYISPEFGTSTKTAGGYGEYVVEINASRAIASLAIEAVAFDASLGAGSGYKAAASGVENATYKNELLVNPAVRSTENNSDIGLSALSYDRVSYSASAPPPLAPEVDPDPTPDPTPDPAPDPNVIYRLLGEREFSGGPRSIINAGDTERMATQQGSIAFSFEADTVAGTHALISKDALWYDGGGNHFSSWIENGTIRFRFEDEDSGTDLQLGGIVANTKHDALATFNQHEVRVYVDGQLIGARDFTMDWTKNTQDLEIGGFGWMDRHSFDGTISDVFIFDGVISPGDYDQLV
jgi:hypothetical protein